MIALEPAAAIERRQHQIGIHRRRARPDRHVLLGAGIDAGVEFPAQFRLQQPDHTVVLQLLTDRPHEDGAQRKRLQTMDCSGLSNR